RELLVLRQTWGDDRIDEDRVEVPSVADPGSQSPQRLGRARLLSHLTRLNLFQQTSQLQICHTPSFAANDRAGMRRAPQHVLWGSAVGGQSGCRSRIT